LFFRCAKCLSAARDVPVCNPLPHRLGAEDLYGQACCLIGMCNDSVTVIRHMIGHRHRHAVL
jgi:hypothetical protein